MATDHYQTLGVSRSASENEIKKAYRALARQWHPDANPDDPGAEQRFKEIAVAYEVLRDPERRANYDRYGDDSPPGMGGFGAGASVNDLFEAFFGAGSPFGGQATSGPRGGNDLEVVVEVDFPTAVLGGEAVVELRAPVACGTCDGRGARPGTSPTRCTTCDGRGQVQQVRRSILGQMVSTSICPACGGHGEIIPDPCDTCRGDGLVTEAKSYTLDIPAGIDHGATLRLTGRGAAGARGGPPGDLYVHVAVGAHPRFRRNGDDLVAVLTVSMTQAALGTMVDFETLEGSEELTIEPGSQSGRVLRVRGRGVPRLRQKGRGDLLVELQVQTPTELTDEERHLLRSFAELRGEEIAETEHGWFGRIRSAFS